MRRILHEWPVMYCGLLVALAAARTPAADRVMVSIETSFGSIDVVIDATNAPITAANFLRYVDAKMYDGGRFHRAVRHDNQVRKDVMIQVVQGGRSPARANAERGFGAIPLERTSTTSLRHVDGAMSMARGNAADSALLATLGAQSFY